MWGMQTIDGCHSVKGAVPPISSSRRRNFSKFSFKNSFQIKSPHKYKCKLYIYIYHHHQVFCPEAGPACVSRLHTSLFSAALFMAWYVWPCLMSSNIILLFLPLGLFPSALPSMTVLSSPSDRMTCPVHRAFLLQMVLINVRSSPTLLSTSSFLTLSVQLIFSILLHTHISNSLVSWCHPSSMSTLLSHRAKRSTRGTSPVVSSGSGWGSWWAAFDVPWMHP